MIQVGQIWQRGLVKVKIMSIDDGVMFSQIIKSPYGPETERAVGQQIKMQYGQRDPEAMKREWGWELLLSFN